ncbi:MarR family transcriptional regulator [Nitrosomonas sp. HPC101]|uniref:MarR family winged helix-turn-helix transcriptional regulator n=1 Tax=Nitrosomonas sp. HPC101 TaxID=1658667 RepID=UPI0013720D1C|nr:MarR family winged helix-turn-helix transcriptional regulator [Nitrosomonas sp. HPC101]MXS84971.1 MarR family transcriptional regulator [Nitrosomonas sp. HPC101]
MLVLGAIALAPQPPNVPQITAVMGVTRQGVLKQINLLVDEGLVQPLPNPAHKRSPLYVLTPIGQTTYDALVDRWNQHVQKIASEFTAADLDAAIRVLTVMSQRHASEPSI